MKPHFEYVPRDPTLACHLLIPPGVSPFAINEATSGDEWKCETSVDVPLTEIVIHFRQILFGIVEDYSVRTSIREASVDATLHPLRSSPLDWTKSHVVTAFDPDEFLQTKVLLSARANPVMSVVLASREEPDNTAQTLIQMINIGTPRIFHINPGYPIFDDEAIETTLRTAMKTTLALRKG